jgi:hypothetical protein
MSSSKPTGALPRGVSTSALAGAAQDLEAIERPSVFDG